MTNIDGTAFSRASGRGGLEGILKRPFMDSIRMWHIGFARDNIRRINYCNFKKDF
jgi:hypothetical protein